MTAAPALRLVDATPVRPRRRPVLVLSGAVVALVLAALAGVWVGALPLPPGAVLATLADRALSRLGVEVPGGLEGTDAAVLLQLRLPRVVLGALVGAGLAVSGAAYQGVFRNPLADPYLLGAAAGAGLGATLVIAYVPGTSLGPVGLVPLAAFAGALLGVGAALLLGTAEHAARPHPGRPVRRPARAPLGRPGGGRGGAGPGAHRRVPGRPLRRAGAGGRRPARPRGAAPPGAGTRPGMIAGRPESSAS